MSWWKIDGVLELLLSLAVFFFQILLLILEGALLLEDGRMRPIIILSRVPLSNKLITVNVT